MRVSTSATQICYLATLHPAHWTRVGYPEYPSVYELSHYLDRRDRGRHRRACLESIWTSGRVTMETPRGGTVETAKIPSSEPEITVYDPSRQVILRGVT